MFDIGILVGNSAYLKNWTVCSKHKSAKRKNRMVANDAFDEYQRYLRKKK
jgi:hypothetical protein